MLGPLPGPLYVGPFWSVAVFEGPKGEKRKVPLRSPYMPLKSEMWRRERDSNPR